MGASAGSQPLLTSSRPAVIKRIMQDPALLKEHGLDFGLVELRNLVCLASVRGFLRAELGDSRLTCCGPFTTLYIPL